MRFAPDPATIPRHWFAGNPLITHAANGLNLLFPDGERFFVRSVKYYLNRIDDPQLREQIRGFFGQEGSHGHEHERFNEVLEAQGYDVETFLRVYRALAYKVIEPAVPPVLRLSATAALEHFTATMAHNGLTDGFLEEAHPAFRDLLLWHAAEEIEHKAVAFDVLQTVDDRYIVRATGLLIATLGLLGFWSLGTAMLMRQEPPRSPEERRAEQAAAEAAASRRGVKSRRELFSQAILNYLRPDFHPDQQNDYELARAHLEAIGRLDG